MKQYVASFAAIAAALFLLVQPVAAQDKDKDNDKSKLNDNEEIIIKKKTDKDTKVTIEIKDGDVKVNGKPIDEFDDDNIVIRKGRAGAYTLLRPHSPFTTSGALNFSDDGRMFNSTIAFLGVVSEKAEKGIKVEEITKGSAAEKAGLKTGDIITKIDDDAINTPEELTSVIRKHKPEDKVTITYERDGKTDKVTATLGKRSTMSFHYEMPAMPAMPDMNFNWNDDNNHVFLAAPKPRLGIKAQDTEDGKGVKVLDVDEESAAEKAGIKEDDIITEFDGKKVNSADELAAAAREAKTKPSVKVTFNRSGKPQTVEIKTPRKLKTANL